MDSSAVTDFVYTCCNSVQFNIHRQEYNNNNYYYCYYNILLVSVYTNTEKIVILFVLVIFKTHVYINTHI